MGVAKVAEGGNSPLSPRCAKIHFNKMGEILYFLPKTLLGGLTAAIHGSGGAPSEEECPLKDKFLATPVCLKLLVE